MDPIEKEIDLLMRELQNLPPDEQSILYDSLLLLTRDALSIEDTAKLREINKTLYDHINYRRLAKIRTKFAKERYKYNTERLEFRLDNEAANAVENGDLEYLKNLVDLGAHKSYFLITRATRINRPDIVNYLLIGNNINHVIKSIISIDDLNAVNYLLNNIEVNKDVFMNALLDAFKKDKPNIVQSILNISENRLTKSEYNDIKNYLKILTYGSDSDSDNNFL